MIAVVCDWFIIPKDYDCFEWPAVPDYNIVKPFKLFVGEIIVYRKIIDLGSPYNTSYMRFFVSNKTLVTVNSTYLLVGEGGLVEHYGAALRESNPPRKDLFI